MKKSTKLFYIPKTDIVTEEDMIKVLDQVLTVYGRKELEDKFSFDLSYELKEGNEK